MGKELPRDAVEPEALAALLSGTLPRSERALVLAQLASNADARIVLQMAIEALEAAESDDQEGDPGPVDRAA